jgi:hypothetical protein
MKNPHAVALGRLGGQRGGRARATALSATRRREIAKDAAAARWGGLPGLLRPLFWSYRFEDLRLPNDENLVFPRVLIHGRAEHLAWLRRRYGD